MFKKKNIGIIVIVLLILSAISGMNVDNKANNNSVYNETEVTPTLVEDNHTEDEADVDYIEDENNIKEDSIVNEDDINVLEEDTEDIEEDIINTDKKDTEKYSFLGASLSKDGKSLEYKGKSYEIIDVDGGDLSGKRKANVAVDVGFGERIYWALTNEYGQLIHVLANKIMIQDDENEPVNSSGRYYNDEAKVPGTEEKDLDEGHVIADSLGGVSNAYNITPQDSTLNRHGDQAYMEKVIREVGGCEDFVATITYPNKTTQIPSKYKYEYVLKGNTIIDEFENVNPDKVNASIKEETADKKPATDKTTSKNESSSSESIKDEGALLSKIDKNGNGKVTIAEAKAAGYSMPIYSDHWLYKYMDDRDGDGAVGE